MNMAGIVNEDIYLHSVVMPKGLVQRRHQRLQSARLHFQNEFSKIEDGRQHGQLDWKQDCPMVQGSHVIQKRWACSSRHSCNAPKVPTRAKDLDCANAWRKVPEAVFRRHSNVTSVDAVQNMVHAWETLDRWTIDERWAVYELPWTRTESRFQ
jgi:hypothetical protein